MSTLDKAFIRAFNKHPEGSPSGEASAAPANAAVNASVGVKPHDAHPMETVAVTFADGIWRRVDRSAPVNAMPAPHITMRESGRQSDTKPPAKDASVRTDEHELSVGRQVCPPQEAPTMGSAGSATFALTAAMESAVRGWQTETQVVALPNEEKASSQPTAAAKHSAAAPEQGLSSHWAAPYFGVVEMLADQTHSPGVAVYEDWELPPPVAEEEVAQTLAENPLPEPCFQWTDAGCCSADFPHDLHASVIIAANESEALAATEAVTEALLVAVRPGVLESAIEDATQPAQENITPENIVQENIVAAAPPLSVVEASPQTTPPEESTVIADPVAEVDPVAEPIAPEQPRAEQATTEQIVTQPVVEKPVAPEQPAVEVETAAPGPKVFAPSWEVDQFKWPPIVDRLLGEEHEQLEQVAIRLLEEARDGKNLLAVTGCVRGEGRTTLTLSLARLASRLGHTVAIVDADFAHHEIGPQLGLDIPQGWECVVSESLRLEEVAVVSLSDRLTAFPLGSTSVNTSFDSERVSVVLQQLAEAFDLVLVDLGPVEATSEQANEPEQAGLTARAILVQDARRPNDAQLQDVVRRLDSLGIEALGIVETFRPAA